jgi:hypothetical protein
MREWKYGSTFLTVALDAGEGSASRLDRFLCGKSAPDSITEVCITPAKNRNSVHRISRLYLSQYTDWTTQHLINVPVWNICNTFSKSCIAVMPTDLVPGPDLIVFPQVHYLLVQLFLILPTCGFSVQHIHRIFQQQFYTGDFARPSCQM